MSAFGSWIRRALPWLMLVIAAAALYDGWIFYSRWSGERAQEQKRISAEAERDRRTIEMLGGDQLKILNFYASPPSIRAGAQSLICYGVNSAKKVRIDPPVEELHPAVSHCFRVAPRRDTEYKLTADDGAGHSVSQSLQIRVAH